MSCTNNLRQMGIGLHNYHSALGTFPPGGIEPRSPKWPSGRQFSWSLMILPYIEQQPLYQSVDTGKAFDAPENAKAAAEIVPTYLCPSTPRTKDSKTGRGPCDYAALYGQVISGVPIPTKPNGVMLFDTPIRIRDIRDGTSHTLQISEDCLSPDAEWINGQNVMEQTGAINDPNVLSFDNEIRSKHPGGANGLFADSSVRFLPETMDLRILGAIITRDGGETITEF